MYNWNVMKLCHRQLRDVNPNDILKNGLYRKCNTYKGGGGYDKFPEIYRKRTGQFGDFNSQFVVQLKGCPLKCPYCYVTEDGVHGSNCIIVSTEQLAQDFRETELPVFHLMGGAPALYVEHWIELLSVLGEDTVFHSDLLLLENNYSRKVISELVKYPNSLYAVSIKGATPEEFKKNTGVDFNKDLFWNNFDTIVACELPFYITYTGMTKESIEIFESEVISRYDEKLLDDSFAIQLIHYKALDD